MFSIFSDYYKKGINLKKGKDRIEWFYQLIDKLRLIIIIILSLNWSVY
jgi:hypothetical protein